MKLDLASESSAVAARRAETTTESTAKLHLAQREASQIGVMKQLETITGSLDTTPQDLASVIQPQQLERQATALRVEVTQHF